MVRHLAIALTVLLLSSCAKAPVIENQVPLKLSKPAPLKMREVKFVVLDDYSSSLELPPSQKPIFGLSENSYLNLAQNLSDIQQYIVLLDSVLSAYKDYYEGNSVTGR